MPALHHDLLAASFVLRDGYVLPLYLAGPRHYPDG
jgi:hypothetical protein